MSFGNTEVINQNQHGITQNSKSEPVSETTMTVTLNKMFLCACYYKYHFLISKLFYDHNNQHVCASIIYTCTVVPCESSTSTVTCEVIWSNVEDTATIITAGGRLSHTDVRQVT